MNRSGHFNEKEMNEIVEIRKARCRFVYDIGVMDEPHLFALASGVLTHNSKRSPMPESVTDRCTKSHEHIFLLAKSPKYFYDHVAVMEEQSSNSHGGNPLGKRTNRHNEKIAQLRNIEKSNLGPVAGGAGRNRRDVWTLKPRNFKGSHFATFPFELPEIAIKAGTSEKGCCPVCGACWVRVVEKETVWRKRYVKYGSYRTINGQPDMRKQGINTETTGWQPTCTCNASDPVPCAVLDPFCGSGTSGVVALSLFRHFIGIELNQDYIDDFIMPRLTREAGRLKQTEIFSSTA